MTRPHSTRDALQRAGRGLRRRVATWRGHHHDRVATWRGHHHDRVDDQRAVVPTTAPHVAFHTVSLSEQERAELVAQFDRWLRTQAPGEPPEERHRVRVRPTDTSRQERVYRDAARSLAPRPVALPTSGAHTLDPLAVVHDLDTDSYTAIVPPSSGQPTSAGADADWRVLRLLGGGAS